MHDVTLNQAWLWLIAGAGAIITLNNAWKIIRKLFHPEQDLRDWKKDVDKRLDNDRDRLKALEDASKETREFQCVIIRVLIAQINHELSGNDIEHLRKARDELNDVLTRR